MRNVPDDGWMDGYGWTELVEHSIHLGENFSTRLLPSSFPSFPSSDLSSAVREGYTCGVLTRSGII